MLQNENDSQDNDCFSLCSSCKSELRSVLSIGTPSYLDASASDISSCIPHDDSQVTEIANAAIKTMRSVSTLGRYSPVENVVSCLPSEKSERIRNARGDASPVESRIQTLSSERTDYSIAENRTQNNRNAIANMTLSTYTAQKLNDTTCKHVYNFVNLRTRIVNDPRNAKRSDEQEPQLFSCIKSRNVVTNSAPEIKSNEQSGQTASSVDRSLQNQLEKIRGGVSSENNADIQTTVPSEAYRVDVDPRRAIDRVAADIDLANRRRNVYELASRVLKFSAYIRKEHKSLLKKYQKGTRAHKNREISLTNGVCDDTDSYVKTISPQDLPMYNYNPLRIKEKQKTKCVQ